MFEISEATVFQLQFFPIFVSCYYYGTVLRDRVTIRFPTAKSSEISASREKIENHTLQKSQHRNGEHTKGKNRT